jgi:hypothetical protein
MKFTIIKRIILSQIMVLILTTGYSAKPDSTVVKRTYQTAFTKTPPVIDGIGNDDAWNLVEWTSDFIQSQPAENKPPSQQTAFKVLYDNDNIYIFVRA